MYFTAALLLNAKQEILKLECSETTLFAYFQDSIVVVDAVEQACTTACELLEKTPPDELIQHMNDCAAGALQIFVTPPHIAEYVVVSGLVNASLDTFVN